MRHGRRGRKLGRTASHKRALMNNMATSLFVHGSIRTTCAKAKELRRVAERLITFAKRGDLHARRMVLRRIQNQVVVSRLFDEIGPGFSERNGGYTRVLKLGARRGDSTEICLVELVGAETRADRAQAGGEAAGKAAPPAEAAPKAAPAEASDASADADEAEADSEKKADS